MYTRRKRSEELLLQSCRAAFVEGLKVINDPKCNKVLNVITF